MEKEVNHPKHQHNPLHDHELEHDEVHEVLVFLRKNGTSIALALAIGVVASIGIIFYRNSQRQRNEAAFRALDSATSAEALLAVAEDFSGTPAEQVAVLEHANRHYRNGAYERARQAYQGFLNRYPEHQMAANVKISIALCQEAAGELEDALASADAFIDGNPGHFLLPQAQFTKARGLAGLGRLQDAKNVYEDFIVANPQSEWVPQAESEMMTIDRQLRAVSRSDS